MKLWQRFAPDISRSHDPRPEYQIRLQLTGRPPANAAEGLIADLTAGRESIPLPWLENRITNALYSASLRHAGGMMDVGIWDATVFREEAIHILGEIHTEFGFFVMDGCFDQSFGR